MELSEKLQELRKNRGMTQEELAQALFVSRTAVSKWESGRGYPSIDSLRELSKFFAVSIDELLSGEKLISLAEKENKANIRKLCDLLLGIVDLFSFALIVLPLYPKDLDGYIYSVNLLSYREAAVPLYWLLSRAFSNVQQGKIFTEENAHYLLGYGLIQVFVAFFVPFIKLFLCWLVSLVSGSRLSIATGQDTLNTLIPSIAILVAAYIIHYGIHLQDEVDHTL